MFLGDDFRCALWFQWNTSKLLHVLIYKKTHDFRLRMHFKKPYQFNMTVVTCTVLIICNIMSPAAASPCIKTGFFFVRLKCFICMRLHDYSEHFHTNIQHKHFYFPSTSHLKFEFFLPKCFESYLFKFVLNHFLSFYY